MADHIQIGDVSPRIQYVADGTQAQFTYPFPIFAVADLEIYLDQAKQGAGFTVAGAGASAGGSVTFAAAPASGVLVTLRRKIAIKRTSDFQESGEFRARVINDELDYQTAALQQVAEDAARAVHLSPTDDAADLTLPDKAARASKFLACDAVGNLIASAGPASGVPVSTFAGTLLDDADSGQARATLGLVIGANVLAPDGDGSALANLPLDAALASDIRLSALAIAHLSGDRLNMVNGWADPLKDETDIETAQNANATYVATGGGYYHNPVSPISGGTGTAIGNLTFNGGLAAAFDGATSQTAAASAVRDSNPGFIGKDWGVGVTKVLSQAVVYPSSDGGMTSGGGSFTATVQIRGHSSAPTTGTEGALLGSSSQAANLTTPLTVSGLTGGTAHRYHWAYITLATGDGLYDVIVAELRLFEAGGAPNMTVVSKAVVAATGAPMVGRLHVQIKDITGGSVANTDFKGYVSRDNGTTYTQGALALVQTLADGTVAYEFDSLDLSAQPSGAAPRFKFATFNNKEIQMHGAVVQWK